MSQPTATPSRRREVSDTDPEWVRFWSTYPRRTGKGAARRAWTKAVRTTDPAKIHAAAEVYAQLVKQEIEKDKREGQGRQTLQFVPHPATWLNHERWSDDLPAPAAERREAYRPPKKHEECPLHQGEWADRCRPCASERLAGPD